MNTRTRNFVVGSLTVVMLGLSVGLVAFYNGGLPLASNRGPSELAYLPADAAVVGYANVREVMDSEFRQKLMTMLPNSPEKDEFMQHTGIDIERDIDTVVAAATTSVDKQGLVLVRGRFNEGQIEGLIRAEGGGVEEYQGIRLVVADPVSMANDPTDLPRDLVQKDPESRSFALAFLESGLVAMGPKSAVKAAVDAKRSGQNATTNDALMQYINDIQGGQSAWAVGRFDAVSESPELPAEIKQHLPAVQWFSVSTRINGGVAGTLRADAADDAAAENLRDVVRGALAMGRLFGGEDPKLKMVMDSMQMSGTGKTVQLNFAVSSDVIDALRGLAEMTGNTPGTRLPSSN